MIRKSLIAKKIIRKGEKFTKRNVTALRPGLGLEPFNFVRMEGKNHIKIIKKMNFYEKKKNNYFFQLQEQILGF